MNVSSRLKIHYTCNAGGGRAVNGLCCPGPADSSGGRNVQLDESPPCPAGSSGHPKDLDGFRAEA